RVAAAHPALACAQRAPAVAVLGALDGAAGRDRQAGPLAVAHRPRSAGAGATFHVRAVEGAGRVLVVARPGDHVTHLVRAAGVRSLALTRRDADAVDALLVRLAAGPTARVRGAAGRDLPGR